MSIKRGLLSAHNGDQKLVFILRLVRIVLFVCLFLFLFVFLGVFPPGSVLTYVVSHELANGDLALWPQGEATPMTHLPCG